VSRRAQGAFTLIELLLSLALMVMLFAAMSQLLFSMADLWGRGAQRRLFERHASAVATHLQTMLAAATRAANSSAFRMIAAEGNEASEAFALELPEGDRVFMSEGNTPYEIICSLQIEQEQGLILHWLSSRDIASGDSRSHRSVMTPFVREMEFEYYDRQAKNWTTGTTLQKDRNGQWVLPWRIRLHFVWDQFVTVRTVAIPARKQALPAF